MNTATKRTLSIAALVLSAAFSTATFAQSGTIRFTGSIVAPACTGSINSQSGANPFAVSLNQCAHSQALVVRTRVADTRGTTITAPEQADGRAIVTLTYE